MHAKKVFSDSQEKNKLETLDNWSILKEKNKNVYKFSKFSIAIMKLNFFVFI
jgi:pterin-4a-carbinolamine dehydratase